MCRKNQNYFTSSCLPVVFYLISSFQRRKKERIEPYIVRYCKCVGHAMVGKNVLKKKMDSYHLISSHLPLVELLLWHSAILITQAEAVHYHHLLIWATATGQRKKETCFTSAAGWTGLIWYPSFLALHYQYFISVPFSAQIVPITVSGLDGQMDEWQSQYLCRHKTKFISFPQFSFATKSSTKCVSHVSVFYIPYVSALSSILRMLNTK